MESVGGESGATGAEEGAAGAWVATVSAVLTVGLLLHLGPAQGVSRGGMNGVEVVRDQGVLFFGMSAAGYRWFSGGRVRGDFGVEARYARA